MPTVEEKKAFHSTIYYHGNKVAPYKLRNHRLEPSVDIQEAPKDWTGKDEDWDNWDYFVNKGNLHKGYFVTYSKPAASYFATEWGKGKSGYLYSFNKPKNIKRALGMTDPEDWEFVTYPIKPKYVQKVKARHRLGGAPANTKVSDYLYGKKHDFDRAVRTQLI